jgi:hypothetical protein
MIFLEQTTLGARFHRRKKPPIRFSRQGVADTPL